MTDKIILTLIGLEWLAFGLIGLFNPLLIASMLDMQLGSLNAISEIRANYAFFACMGFIALFSLWRVKLMRTAYLTFCIVLGMLFIRENFKLYPRWISVDRWINNFCQ